MINIEAFGVIIYYLTKEEFNDRIRDIDVWYKRFIRGICYTSLKEVYINDEAFYFSESDKKRLVLHEIGHCIGLEHSKVPFSTMFFSGVLRR